MTPRELLDCASRLIALHRYRGADANDLIALLNRLPRRQYGQWESLCKEGEAGDELFFLLRGAVEVLKEDTGGQERPLGTIKAPAILGHMSLVDRSARSATCRAMGPVVVATLDRAGFDALFDEHTAEGSTLRRLLAASIADQLAQANAHLRDLIAPADGDVSDAQVMTVKGHLRGWHVAEPAR